MNKYDETYTIFGEFGYFKSDPTTAIDLFKIFITFDFQPSSVQVLQLTNIGTPLMMPQYTKENESFTFYPDKLEYIYRQHAGNICVENEGLNNAKKIFTAVDEKYNLFSKRVTCISRYYANSIDFSKYISRTKNYEIDELVEWEVNRVKRVNARIGSFNEDINVIEKVSYNELGILNTTLSTPPKAGILIEVNTFQLNNTPRFKIDDIKSAFEELYEKSLPILED